MKRFLLLILLISIHLGGAYAQKIYLVSVGISDYPGKDADLRLTVKDATAIKSIYDKNRKAETLLITDELATSNNILSKMEQLFSKAKPEDIVILFFSGHGYEGGFVGSDGYAISYTEIKRAMAKSVAKNKMIFADACFSGQFREAGSGSNSSPTASSSDQNVLLFLSSRSDEISLERNDMKNGYFTHYLQDALKGRADTNLDRKITAKELYTHVSKGVISISKNKQHPVMWGKFEDSMPVIVW